MEIAWKKCCGSAHIGRIITPYRNAATVSSARTRVLDPEMKRCQVLLLQCIPGTLYGFCPSSCAGFLHPKRHNFLYKVVIVRFNE